MINRIKQLTKIFLLDYYQKLNLIDPKTNKINKKNKIVWLSGILVAALTYLSFEIIKILMRTGQPILFLKIYLPIVATIIIFQLILLTCNIFFYSKDLKDILPLPIKPVEILIAKLNTMAVIMYFIEGLLLVVPLIIFGILVQKTIKFFIFLAISIIIFPIIYILIISFLMLFLMKLTKFIKNRGIFQILITTILVITVNYTIINRVTNIILEENNDNNLTQIEIINQKTDKINDVYIVTNPIIKMMTSDNIIEILKNFSNVIIINTIIGIIFLKVGKDLYFKNILKNINNIDNVKIKIKQKIKCRKKNKILNYLNNDIKSIIRNPMFFIQNIIQYVSIVILFCFLICIFLPMIMQEAQSQNVLEEVSVEQFKIETTLIVVAIIQLIFTFSNLSITAISREGKNAIFMKYIPISLCSQITLKAMPQIIINIFVIMATLICIYLNFIKINIVYYIVVFILAMLINLINSYVMVLVDLRKPNLNWTNEESVAKDNENKLYQYIFTIFIFLILVYFSKLFKNFNFNIAIIIINIIFLIFFIIIKIYINKNISKIFKKIF